MSGKKGNIILIGMPGCGKTTFGRELAAALQRRFYDADEVLEERERRTIKSFFAESEKAFRAAETRTLKYLAGLTDAVIATGGGAVTRPENMALLSACGEIVFIDRQPEKILQNIAGDSRPLLAADKLRIFRLYEQRIGLYRKYAGYTVDNNGPAEDAAACLLEFVRREQK